MGHLGSRLFVGVLALQQVAPPIANARSSEHGPLAQDTSGWAHKRKRKEKGKESLLLGRTKVQQRVGAKKGKVQCLGPRNG